MNFEKSNEKSSEKSSEKSGKKSGEVKLCVGSLVPSIKLKFTKNGSTIAIDEDLRERIYESWFSENVSFRMSL